MKSSHFSPLFAVGRNEGSLCAGSMPTRKFKKKGPRMRVWFGDEHPFRLRHAISLGLVS